VIKAFGQVGAIDGYETLVIGDDFVVQGKSTLDYYVVVFSRRYKTDPTNFVNAISLSPQSQPAVAQMDVQAENGVLAAQPNEKANSLTLTIKAQDSCFVFLKADASIVFQGVLKNGQSESFQAQDYFTLSLGNGGAVELEVNGKSIKNIGKSGQALKDIMITKEGLSSK
jgi:hypothetical protein